MGSVMALAALLPTTTSMVSMVLDSSLTISSARTASSITSIGATQSTNSATKEISFSTPATLFKSRKVLLGRADVCENLLIDDFSSQSRLTFLYYNSIFQASSDDGTMKSVVVGTPSAHHVTLTPNSIDSYWFSHFGCVNAVGHYGGVSMRIKAAKGTTLSVQLQSSATCDSENNLNLVQQTSSQLGWTFDGSEKLYSIPFTKFSGLGLNQLVSVSFTSLNKPVSFGPLAFYCGSTVSEYPIPAVTSVATPTATVPVPAGTAPALVIDTFKNKDSNDLTFWRGVDDGMILTFFKNKVTLSSNDPDYAFYTQISNSCSDMTKYDSSYLHIAYSGSSSFTIALQQHNAACNETATPYPETWDSLSAERYASKSTSDIYIPMSHFHINRTRAVGFALKGFYPLGSTTTTSITKIELVPSVPAAHSVPSKLPNGNLVFACTRPNSFAFAIDDGNPALAQEVLNVIRDEGIKVTFFTVGMPLLDPATNLTNVYREMRDAGHQIAYHSYTHPKMEGLPGTPDIDWEYDLDMAAVRDQLGLSSRYFRPPFGTEGARMRERLAAKIEDPVVVNWSVDVEDWIWAETSTPEKQLDAFRRDVGKGGNLMVMHYLYPSTVSYLRQFIQIAKATGKTLMRVDQCLEDAEAPPL